MGKRLLIVESPGKIKKIKEYLGDGWEIKASIGHICDLSIQDGINKANGFKLNYEISPDRKEVVAALKEAVKTVGKENVFFATDPDREGEAIGFHLCRTLGIEYREAKRVTFQEITKKAITEAVSKPRGLNMALVSAQEARRAIDRLVGFEISPLLKNKIKSDKSLSAGRVQSVAVKLVVEREREIDAFNTEAGFRVQAEFLTVKQNKLRAKAGVVDGDACQELVFTTKDEAIQFLKSTDDNQYVIKGINKVERKTLPQPPFSTSTLQQSANKKLKFSVDKTMKVAQELYEAGHITYMRTDSVNLSETAITELSKHIATAYGSDYFEARRFKNKNETAQEAHEAVRPTHFESKDVEGTKDQKELYSLIYQRAVASQMKAKLSDVTTINIEAEFKQTEPTRINHSFIAKATVETFDGFTKALAEEIDEDPTEDPDIEIKEAVNEGDWLTLASLTSKQSYSKPKARYGEAELVKEMEKMGIGRPSTYASIIKNIKDVRQYISIGNAPGRKFDTLTIIYENGKLSEQKSSVTLGQSNDKFIPNPIAYEVISFLQDGFADIVDYRFTAHCEDLFDNIVDGKTTYGNVVKDFYSTLDRSLVEARGKYADIGLREKKTVYVGDYQKTAIRAGKNERGVYVIFREKFYPVSGVDDITAITVEDAVDAIAKKSEADKAYKEEKEANTLYQLGKFKIIKGKYGPYVTDGNVNASIPKWELDKLASFDEAKCKEVIKNYKAYKRKQDK